MWISNSAWMQDQRERMKLSAEREAAVLRAEQQKGVLEWMMARLTQLEFERAQLLRKYMGLDIPLVSAERENVNSDMETPDNRLPNFNDMGDDAAALIGASWDEHGNLVYNNPTLVK